jgi:hypothetical protein
MAAQGGPGTVGHGLDIAAAALTASPVADDPAADSVVVMPADSVAAAMVVASVAAAMVVAVTGNLRYSSYRRGASFGSSLFFSLT